MILDTTYILPVAKIDIDTDLLTLIYDGKVPLSMDDVKISLISLFELQANISRKYKLPPAASIDAIGVIRSTLKIEPFYNPGIIKAADTVSKYLPDYIDCLILATAISLKEDLATEDTKILGIRDRVRKEYGINLMSYKEVLNR